MKIPDEKLAACRGVFINRNTMPGMAAFVAEVAFLHAGDVPFLAGAGVMFAWLIFIVPTRGRIANDLEISPELVP